jgi:hypothetical protein
MLLSGLAFQKRYSRKEGVGRIVLQIQNRKETQKYGEDKSHDLIIG